MKYKISVTIVTDYSKDELEEVLEKLLEIPATQYNDCGKFAFNINSSVKIE